VLFIIEIYKEIRKYNNDFGRVFSANNKRVIWV
jgi:hypothetical protein